MTGLWGQAIDAEVAYRHDAVRESYARRGGERVRRQPRPASAPRSRLVVVGSAGVVGAAAGMMAPSGRR